MSRFKQKFDLSSRSVATYRGWFTDGAIIMRLSAFNEAAKPVGCPAYIKRGLRDLVDGIDFNGRSFKGLVSTAKAAPTGVPELVSAASTETSVEIVAKAVSIAGFEDLEVWLDCSKLISWEYYALFSEYSLFANARCQDVIFARDADGKLVGVIACIRYT